MGAFSNSQLQSNTNITGNETEDNPFITDAEEMIDTAPLETIEYEEGDSDIEID